jgi:hypothetical protein
MACQKSQKKKMTELIWLRMWNMGVTCEELSKHCIPSNLRNHCNKQYGGQTAKLVTSQYNWGAVSDH